MLLTRLLNACHHFPGFVYESARLCQASNTVEIDVRPRRGSRPHCSGCGQQARGYDERPLAAGQLLRHAQGHPRRLQRNGAARQSMATALISLLLSKLNAMRIFPSSC